MDGYHFAQLRELMLQDLRSANGVTRSLLQKIISCNWRLRSLVIEKAVAKHPLCRLVRRLNGGKNICDQIICMAVNDEALYQELFSAGVKSTSELASVIIERLPDSMVPIWEQDGCVLVLRGVPTTQPLQHVDPGITLTPKHNRYRVRLDKMTLPEFCAILLVQ